MGTSQFLSIMLMGLISGNVITASGVGIDLAGNNLNTIKHSLILSLFIFGVTLCSGIVLFVTNLILTSLELQNFFVVLAVLVVAVFVQIAEFMLEKLFPIVHTRLGSFVVSLIPTVAIILLSIFTKGVSFGVILLDILFICLGITAVLACIAGVRNNKLTYSSYDVFKGNLMTLAILFVMAIIWTAV